MGLKKIKNILSPNLLSVCLNFEPPPVRIVFKHTAAVIILVVDILHLRINRNILF